MPTRRYTDAELQELQQELGVEFVDRGLLLQALTHESFLNEWSSEELSEFDAESNQRLEFLGDSVLNFTVAEMLYRSLPNADEGTLSLARSHVVRKETLAEAAREMSLGELIVFGQGESRSGLAERDSVLEDAYEALVGALFVDQGVEAAESFIKATLGGVVGRVSTEGVEKDSKSAFQELVQAEGFRSPKYATDRAPRAGESEIRYVSRVAVGGDTAGQGSGTSKSKAEQDAARVALERFSDGVPRDFGFHATPKAGARFGTTKGRRRIETKVGKPIQPSISRRDRGGFPAVVARLLSSPLRGLGISKTSAAKRTD